MRASASIDLMRCPSLINTAQLLQVRGYRRVVEGAAPSELSLGRLYSWPLTREMRGAISLSQPRTTNPTHKRAMCQNNEHFMDASKSKANAV
jgi:hypothetical protein